MKRYDEMPKRQRAQPEAARFVLLVDHQSKRSFDMREAAEQEARRILDRYPHLNVRVEDCDGERVGDPTRNRPSLDERFRAP